MTATGADSDSSSIRASSLANGSDSSGFGALPAGSRGSGGGFYFFGSSGRFWSSTELSDSDAYDLYLGYGDANVFSNDKTNGYSVRCLKD